MLPNRAPSSYHVPPVSAAEREGATALGEEDDHVDGDQGEGDDRAGVVSGGARTTFVRWRAHSGQRIPTGVGVMQSGQIGRPQLEQETPVSRQGWR